MKTYNKNCIICNKEFTGVWKRKLCENPECKKQNVRNTSKRIQKNRSLDERIKHSERCRKWRIKTRYKAPRRLGLKVKKEKTLDQRIMGNLEGRVHMATKRQNTKKTKKVIDLLGCSLEEFKDYLEKKFQIGMVWQNYTTYGWHIDHIKPCIAFNLKDPKQQEECFHYTNLQPLWWWENISKNEYISHLKRPIEFKTISPSSNIPCRV